MKLKVFTDGGARGNPGIAGYGVYIENENKESVYEESKFLGIKTNNEAEYMGLIGALTWIEEKAPEAEVEINSDSQLLVRQMKKIYKVKASNLKNLWLVAQDLSSGKKIEYKEIRREYNFKADELANLAMDRKK
ncbi:MAG: Ribonuclease HI [Candidatus Shapirobacteria bacterium GW2011_GWE1_38_10]|uniref:Ribonuclease HI n=1 Tax=Candidatus Shapirobacteria bacterium GW2011_GWE1_38_10 TaxID=1618488 RepID=A0A0G0LB27_9BACT|nr:MAG: Ribonuclease HI [Candidatus Shapirobacteria bacterium GW2011_GWF2_37_20]KKQ49876.1 MAG: Ribonuclease HI [Candidatus Shapirobacteria bacterium GW2011_GWE1_38_10]KKQ64174.1 MAG: Ribonuclease HI [Candidatus Shapirobacteria bacterium GW2011_GWF1_38_23]HBP50720.1 ribonuclease H [Candidatus Shapirobacteria bacterium]